MSAAARRTVRILVVCFSHSGNNRLLAETVARRLDADACAVVERRRRTFLTIILDMLLRRTPQIEPLPVTPTEYEHVVLVAPVWDSKVANPMRALMQREKEALASFSFLTLCGYEREGQREDLEHELASIIGRPASAVCELKVCELLPAGQRDDVKLISRYRVTERDMARFEPLIAEFCRTVQSLPAPDAQRSPSRL